MPISTLILYLMEVMFNNDLEDGGFSSTVIAIKKVKLEPRKMNEISFGRCDKNPKLEVKSFRLAYLRLILKISVAGNPTHLFMCWQVCLGS